MRIVANRQLTGVYGTVSAGQEFECHDATALELLQAGFVQRAGAPAVRYETKVIVPAEAPQVSARDSFRHVPVSDARPETVAAAGDCVFPGPDAPQRGAADSGGRRGRQRPGSAR